MVERLAGGAEPFGLERPSLAPGSEANVALCDLDAEWTVGEDGYESRSENSWCAGPRADRAGADDRRRRPGRLPAAQLLALGVARHEHGAAATSCSRTGPASTASSAAHREPVTGEVVFNTAMTGYQESVTDPSYAGQIIVFTYPLIGNYGVSAEAMESDRIHARGVVMRDAKNGEDVASAEGGWLDWLADCGVPGIGGVDTRALVRHIRDRGAMRGGIFPAELAEAEARERIAAEPSMDGADLARTVTPPEPVRFEGDGPHVVGIDTGIKLNIVRQLRERGCRLTLLPCTASAEEVLAEDPDLVFLANGPGDPAALDYVVETVRELVGKRPMFGICLGHQLLCRAVGLETFKLPFGHRGANHPVKDLATGRIDITSQNHGFAVAGPGRRAADRGRRAGALGDRLRRRRALPPQPLRPHGRGPRPARRRRGDRPVPPRGRARPARRPPPLRQLPGSSPMPKRDRHREDPADRLGADRDRPGGRVRLLRRAGLQGAARGGLRGRARQLEPGDDHDRPRVRDRDLRRAAAARAGARIIEKERPDALLPTLGGQTALNVAMALLRGRHAGALRGRADRRRPRRRSAAPRTARSSAAR